VADATNPVRDYVEGVETVRVALTQLKKDLEGGYRLDAEEEAQLRQDLLELRALNAQLREFLVDE
jgi:hypothetical protein